MEKLIYVVKLEKPVSDHTLESNPPKGKIVEIMDPINGTSQNEKRNDGPLEDEEYFIVSWPVMHRICQAFNWDYSLMLKEDKE